MRKISWSRLFSAFRRGERKRVLFVTYGGGHVNMIIPVLKELKEDHRIESIVVGLTMAAKVLQNAGFSSIGFSDLEESESAEVQKWGKELASLTAQNPSIDPKETIAYLGLSMKDLVDKVGAAEALRLFKKDGRVAFLPVPTLSKIIAKYKPDLVVATNSPRAEKASLIAAREAGIPSICLFDLLEGPKETVGQPGYGQQICVLSEGVKRHLIAMGRPENEIRVTGNPAFDYLVSKDLKARASEEKASRGWTDKKVILWAREYRPASVEPSNEIEAEMIRLAMVHPEWVFIFRPHPNEIKPYENLPSNVQVLATPFPLATVIAMSDVVMTLTSTVGLEGFLAGKSLIQLKTAKDLPIQSYTEMGIATPLNRARDLESVLKKIFGNKERVANNGFNVGSAAMNVAKLIRATL